MHKVPRRILIGLGILLLVIIMGFRGGIVGALAVLMLFRTCCRERAVLERNPERNHAVGVRTKFEELSEQNQRRCRDKIWFVA